MTRLRALLISALILLTGLTTATVIPVMVTGCKTTPAPRAVAYVAMKDTWAAVKASMRVYADACAQEKVSMEKQKEIDAAYEKFRLSFLQAIELGKLNYTSLTPTDQQQLANQLINLITKLDL